MVEFVPAAQTNGRFGKKAMSINLMGRLRTFGRFVGNGLDRSVQSSR